MTGLENVFVDALTRQYDDEEESAIIHAISHNLSNVDLTLLARAQHPLMEETASSLQLEEVRFPGVDQPVVCNTSLGRPRVLVPEARKRSIFDAVQGLAHPSGKTTLAILSRAYVWNNMRCDVFKWAGQCSACVASKVERHARPPVLPIPVPATRFGHVHLDIVGTFSPDQGFRYLITMVDRTMRWPEAVPVQDTTADTVLQAFLGTRVSRFGIPENVTTDRGAQFTSDSWKTSLRRLGISVAATTAYHPQANGLVERFHRSLKNSLRCAVRTSNSWTRSLSWVMLTRNADLRNAPKGDTATSTVEVVYGVPLRILGLCFQDKQSTKQSAN